MSNNKAKSDGDLSAVLLQLSNAITNMNASSIRTPVETETKVTETFVFGQVVKYDGSNVKAWISTVRSAFNACGKSHFLEREIQPTEAEYAEYCRYFGLMIFTFAPKTIELIQHCKSVFSIWTYMVRFEKDSFASSVRKFTQMLNTSYTGGELRQWIEKLNARFEDLESDWMTLNESSSILQQQFNCHVFKLEQDEYVREGIDWQFITFTDNQPVIDLIESKPIGILCLLDEECRMPQGNDRTWCSKLYKQITVGDVFKKPKFNFQTSFIIEHFADVVTYNVDATIYLNNISVKDGDTSPYELFFGRSPSQYHYRSSGCVVNHQQPSSKCLSNRIYRNRSVDHLPSSSSSSSSSTFIRSVVSDSELNRIDSFNRIDRHDLGNSEWITVNRKSRKKQSSYYHSRKCL
ncbi:Unconventional myosin-Va [Dermatophagoides farinae]|uniref:Unconventional myosin-Va n=1 Tax=Dermatophagoides farinae TaxID=6954 RepID=A0A922I4M7_DERFA|nr:Unconventional myosin-Va [Dermatophagoides farinae]